MIAFSS